MTTPHPAAFLPAPPVADVRDLRRGEHLVLFGFRALALGHGDCPVLRRTFGGLLGADADDALMHMLAFVRVVGGAGVRRVRLHPPGCHHVSQDERRVLAAVAAAQGSLYAPDDAPLREAVEALLGRPAPEAAVFAAQAVAAALTLSSLELPVRAEVQPDMGAGFGAGALDVQAPDRRTVH